MLKKEGWLALAALLIAGTGVTLAGGQVYMRAKALLAARLIERAYEAYLEDGRPHRAWLWADFQPLGRIEIPRLGVRRTILSGATGSSLAFGLGHVSGTALPGGPGNSAVAGHRDSWARFMQRLRPGDEVCLTTPGGRTSYRVTQTRIVTLDDVEALEPTAGDRITLITCYPFSGWTDSRWRMIVVCERSSEREA